ncbi:hypothetical protein CHUAL_011383 [Chamberlinius hualienensis]
MQCITPPTLPLMMDDPKNTPFNLQSGVMANPSGTAATPPTDQQQSSVTTSTPSSSCSTTSSTVVSTASLSVGSILNKTPISSPPNIPTSIGSSNSTATSSTPCCDSGRMILTDPLTGQTVCSCQYDSTSVAATQQHQAQQQLLNYQRLAAASTHGLPINMYGTVPYTTDPAYLPVGAALTEQSAFYPPTDNFGTWPYPASMYYPYDPSFAYSYANGYVMDVNGVRQKPKNATRETTSTLKAWLSEHRKNPYPTKGEKIMLAIITRMTLTQVSTWFANARRRLKKENKMTWEPRNRVDDDDDHDEVGNSGSGQPIEKGTKSSENGFDSNPRPISVDQMSGLGPSLGNDVRRDDMGLPLGSMSGGISQRDSLSSPTSSIMSDSRSSIQSPCLNESSESNLPHQGLFPHPQHHPMMNPNSQPSQEVGHQSNSLKPRIWSIVDTATSNNSNVTTTATINNPMLNNNFMHGLNVNSGMYPGSNNLPPGAKVSQQFVKTLRFGYASPYVKAPWTNDVTVLNSNLVSAPGDLHLSASPSSSLSSSSTPSSSVSTPPCLPNHQLSSINNNNNGLKSVIETNPTASTSAMVMSHKMHNVNLTGFSGGGGGGSSSATPTSLTTGSSIATSCASTAGSYPMSTIAAAAAAAAYNTNTMNSALLGRAYAQTIQNLSNLTKGLLMTGATGTQLTGASPATHYVGSVKTATQGPLQPDQRSEMQSSTS